MAMRKVVAVCMACGTVLDCRDLDEQAATVGAPPDERDRDSEAVEPEAEGEVSSGFWRLTEDAQGKDEPAGVAIAVAEDEHEPAPPPDIGVPRPAVAEDLPSPQRHGADIPDAGDIGPPTLRCASPPPGRAPAPPTCERATASPRWPACAR